LEEEGDRYGEKKSRVEEEKYIWRRRGADSFIET
jgi:hypothetical protein